MSLKGSLREKIKSLPVPATPEKSRPTAIKKIFSSAQVFYLNPDSLKINTHQSLKSGILASSLCCLPMLALFPCKLVPGILRWWDAEQPSDIKLLCQTENPMHSSTMKTPSNSVRAGAASQWEENLREQLSHTSKPTGNTALVSKIDFFVCPWISRNTSYQWSGRRV